jgi:hypothetical protein
MAREKIAIWAFIKFGSKENIDRLLNLGEIFINRISAFPEMKDEYRGDIFEGASDITPGKRIGSLIYTNSLGQSIDFTKNGLSVSQRPPPKVEA